MRNSRKYPENWKDEIRPRILKRDNFKCTQCKVKHRSYVFIDQSNKTIIINREEHEELKREGLRTYRVYLQVAHLDNDTANNSDTNLKAMCPKCHNEYDKQWKLAIRLSVKSPPTCADRLP